MDRLHIAVVVLLACVLAVGLGGQASPTTHASPPTEMELIEPVPNGSQLWPYTSKTRSVETRTLAVNIIVRGDREAVRNYFRRHADGNWTRRPHPVEPEDPGEAVLPIGDDGVVWRSGHASARYTFIAPADEEDEGVWVQEAYELFDGPYLESRFHVRAYVPPTAGEDWTAMQAHREYWDWFGLRHTVTSVSEAQRYVEADLRDGAPSSR